MALYYNWNTIKNRKYTKLNREPERKYTTLYRLPMNGNKKIAVSAKELQSLNVVSEGNDLMIYEKDANTLYKVYSNYEEDLKNISDIMDMEIENAPKITAQLIIGGEYTGYAMQLLKHTHTFREGVDSILSNELRIKYAEDICKAIREVHKQGYSISLINLDSLAYDSENGYVLSIDKTQKIEGDSNEQKVIAIDNIKTSICALSLIYGVDLENTLKRDGLKGVIYNLKYLINDEKLLNTILCIFNGNSSDKSLDEVLSQIKQNISLQTSTQKVIAFANR